MPQLVLVCSHGSGGKHAFETQRFGNVHAEHEGNVPQESGVFEHEQFKPPVQVTTVEFNVLEFATLKFAALKQSTQYPASPQLSAVAKHAAGATHVLLTHVLGAAHALHAGKAPHDVLLEAQAHVVFAAHTPF